MDIHDALFEVSLESCTLMALGLPVLHGSAPQVVIYLGGVYSCCSLLILGGALAQPIMDIVGEVIAGLVSL